jgi:prophage DNA circulation protein
LTFDPSLPAPYKTSWREAYRYDKDDSPRLTSYQSPDGAPVPFVLTNFKFSGGQAVDTGEYPYFGLWSNEVLNEKPQAITVSGCIRGETYIQNRNDMIEALRARTDDEKPGYIDLPLWGRFPVVVVSFDVEEKGLENGQCGVSITLTRAGANMEERRLNENDPDMDAIAEEVKTTSIKDFIKNLKDNIAANTLVAGFTKVKQFLIGIVGRVQGAQSELNAMTNAVTGITNLIAQGIQAPASLAQTFYSSIDSMAAGVASIKNSVSETSSYFRTRDNIKNMLMNFLSVSSYRLDVEAVTVKEYATREAMENLVKTASLYAASRLFVQAEDMTYQQKTAAWKLYENLESAVNLNDSELYKAVQSLRNITAKKLSSVSTARELIKEITVPVPVLYLAHFLGSSDSVLRQFNRIEDSFVVKGEITYV